MAAKLINLLIGEDYFVVSLTNDGVLKVTKILGDSQYPRDVVLDDLPPLTRYQILDALTSDDDEP